MAAISYNREGNVGVIEMNGPPANSYGISFVRELDAAIDTAEGDEASWVAMIKRTVYDGANAALAASLAIERRNIATLFHSDDAKVGFLALTERRKPNFAGR
jgi:enoyl-CoA hydratase/carnithine racemase